VHDVALFTFGQSKLRFRIIIAGAGVILKGRACRRLDFAGTGTRDRLGRRCRLLLVCRYDSMVVSTRGVETQRHFQEPIKECSMKSLICGACTLGVLTAMLAIATAGRAADEDTPSIDKIMDTLHKGRKSPLATLKGALRSQSPDWAAVQKETKTYAKYAAYMPKNKPPKGDDSSFQKLAKAFATNAKALDDAAKKEDLTATKAAFGKLGGSCKSCHDAHKDDE
jgi:cytochrome c556